MRNVRVSTALLLISLVVTSVAANSAPNEAKADFSPNAAYLDCTRFTWMHDCRQVNEWVAKNPEKPLRVAKEGLEFYFPPGTPSAYIDWHLNQTDEALERYIQYLEREHAFANRAAAKYNAYVERRGGLRGMPGLESINAAKTPIQAAKINSGKIAVYYFYDSRCPACASMKDVIASLRATYPKLSISLLQFDDSVAAAKSMQLYVGAPVNVLKGPQLATYESRVPRVPAVWIENKSTGQYTVLEGVQSLTELARHLEKESR